MYLIKFTSKGNIIKSDDGVMAVPEFKDVIEAEGYGPQAMKWVALVMDYDSPYRHFGEKERIRSVSLDIYGTHSWKGCFDDVVLRAMDKYKELQYDPLDEQLRAFNSKINEYTTLINNTPLNEENAESMQKIMTNLEKMLKTSQVILDTIERRGERKKIQGDRELSFLERKQEIKSNING